MYLPAIVEDGAHQTILLLSRSDRLAEGSNQLLHGHGVTHLFAEAVTEGVKHFRLARLVGLLFRLAVETGFLRALDEPRPCFVVSADARAVSLPANVSAATWTDMTPIVSPSLPKADFCMAFSCRSVRSALQPTDVPDSITKSKYRSPPDYALQAALL